MDLYEIENCVLRRFQISQKYIYTKSWKLIIMKLWKNSWNKVPRVQNWSILKPHQISEFWFLWIFALFEDWKMAKTAVLELLNSPKLISLWKLGRKLKTLKWMNSDLHLVTSLFKKYLISIKINYNWVEYAFISFFCFLSYIVLRTIFWFLCVFMEDKAK